MIVQHFRDGAALKPEPGLEPNLMLIGHIHTTTLVQSSPYYILMTTSAEEYARAGYLEFQRTASGWFSPTPPGWASGGDDVMTLVSDWGAPKVTVTFDAPNDGTQARNRAVVDNRLVRRFSDGRVRFVMKAGRYNVAGGTALAAYQDDSGTKTVVDVRVNLPARATATVHIDYAGAAPDGGRLAFPDAGIPPARDGGAPAPDPRGLDAGAADPARDGGAGRDLARAEEAAPPPAEARPPGAVAAPGGGAGRAAAPEGPGGAGGEGGGDEGGVRGGCAVPGLGGGGGGAASSLALAGALLLLGRLRVRRRS
jgi:hypothetical protein